MMFSFFTGETGYPFSTVGRTLCTSRPAASDGCITKDTVHLRLRTTQMRVRFHPEPVQIVMHTAVDMLSAHRSRHTFLNWIIFQMNTTTCLPYGFVVWSWRCLQLNCNQRASVVPVGSCFQYGQRIEPLVLAWCSSREMVQRRKLQSQVSS